MEGMRSGSSFASAVHSPAPSAPPRLAPRPPTHACCAHHLAPAPSSTTIPTSKPGPQVRRRSSHISIPSLPSASCLTEALHQPATLDALPSQLLAHDKAAPARAAYAVRRRPLHAAASSAAPPRGFNCFKCGQAGHWANACPQQPAAGPQAPAAALPGTCFRCGQPGHWVKDCPEATEPEPDAAAPASPAVSPPPPPHLFDLFPSTQLLMPSRQPGYLRYHLRADQRSPEWHTSRDSRLTASAMLKALGINPTKKGAHGASPRRSLFYDKLGITKVTTNSAMKHGNKTEATAMHEYCKLTGSAVMACDFVTYQQLPPTEAAALQLPGPGEAWLGGSPDGLILGSEAAALVQQRLAASALQQAAAPEAAGATSEPPGLSTSSTELETLMDQAGILEIKCPWTPGVGDAEKNSKYLFQIQALMEILDLGWADLFIYSQDKELLQVRVERDPDLWAEMLPHLTSFWWDNLVPARRALEKRCQEAGQGLTAEEQKAVVKEYLPTALPGNATARLSEWTRDMYERADKDFQQAGQY